jgi:hypothetical protein
LPQIKQNLQNVFITENEINFLCFPRLKHSLVIFGAGYGFENLAQITWLNQVNIYYWGDIDSHGFAILDQLRTKLPQVKSLLMDEKTLLAHKEFWGEEPKPEHRMLSRLANDELDLYQKLTSNAHGKNVRLEQEKVSYAALMGILNEMV